MFIAIIATRNSSFILLCTVFHCTLGLQPWGRAMWGWLASRRLFRMHPRLLDACLCGCPKNCDTPFIAVFMEKRSERFPINHQISLSDPVLWCALNIFIQALISRRSPGLHGWNLSICPFYGSLMAYQFQNDQIAPPGSRTYRLHPSTIERCGNKTEYHQPFYPRCTEGKIGAKAPEGCHPVCKIHQNTQTIALIHVHSCSVQELRFSFAPSWRMAVAATFQFTNLWRQIWVVSWKAGWWAGKPRLVQQW